MHQRVASFSSYFSDLKHNEIVMIAEDDKVAFRSKLEGIHTGEFMGVAGSNKRFSVVEMGFFKIPNGKIAEMWGLLNTYELMQQLGVIKQEK